MSSHMHNIICIGCNVNAEVNVYYTHQDVPIIEIRNKRSGSSVRFRIPEAQALMELLEEAMGFWHEERFGKS